MKEKRWKNKNQTKGRRKLLDVEWPMDILKDQWIFYKYSFSSKALYFVYYHNLVCAKNSWLHLYRIIIPKHCVSKFAQKATAYETSENGFWSITDYRRWLLIDLFSYYSRFLVKHINFYVSNWNIQKYSYFSGRWPGFQTDLCQTAGSPKININRSQSIKSPPSIGPKKLAVKKMMINSWISLLFDDSEIMI